MPIAMMVIVLWYALSAGLILLWKGYPEGFGEKTWPEMIRDVFVHGVLWPIVLFRCHAQYGGHQCVLKRKRTR